MSTKTPPGPTAEEAWYKAATANEKAERVKFLVETALLKEQLAEAEQNRAVRDSLADQRRIYDFVGEVEQVKVGSAVDDLNDWVMRSTEPIVLRLNSPGGDAFDGIMLYDFIRELQSQHGVAVLTHGIGLQASMGSILMQAGSYRLLSRNSWFMVHEPSSVAFGKAGDIKVEADMMRKLHRQLCGILAERSSLTLSALLKRCAGKDWWLTAEEAVKFGFADEVV